MAWLASFHCAKIDDKYIHGLNGSGNEMDIESDRDARVQLPINLINSIAHQWLTHFNIRNHIDSMTDSEAYVGKLILCTTHCCQLYDECIWIIASVINIYM